MKTFIIGTVLSALVILVLYMGVADTAPTSSAPRPPASSSDDSALGSLK